MTEAESGELDVVASGEEPVRNYLRGLHMPEYDISLYIDEARQGPGPATFSFGEGDQGIIPEFRLSREELRHDVSDYVLRQRIT